MHDLACFIIHFHFLFRISVFCEYINLRNQVEGQLIRKLFNSDRFYNQDLTTGSLLIEIGGHGNNLNEALYAGQLAAKGLAAALLGGA